MMIIKTKKLTSNPKFIYLTLSRTTSCKNVKQFNDFFFNYNDFLLNFFGDDEQVLLFFDDDDTNKYGIECKHLPSVASLLNS